MKGDQAYTCNLQPWITIFPGSYFIMRIALCIHIWTWHTLHILRINKYIILWRVNYQMWRCQLRVLTSSVLIKLFACYLISLGLTPAYDNTIFPELMKFFSLISKFLLSKLNLWCLFGEQSQNLNNWMMLNTLIT